MAEISKPDFTHLWANAGTIVAPSNSKIDTGWTAEVPPYQWENFSQNRQDQGIAHILQHGISVWDNATEYHAGKSYVQGSDGKIYVALQTHTNQNPVTDVSETYWADFYRKRIVTITTPGVSSWTVPTILQLGLKRAKVTTVGAGGGGGGVTSSANHNAGGGGGGAGGSAIEYIDLTGVTSVSVTIGAGGSGGANGGATGTAGGTSSFGAYNSATGGSAGNSVNAGTSVGGVGAGGGGGLGSGGDINSRGAGGLPGVIAQVTTAGSTASGGFGGASILSGGVGGGAILGSGGSGGVTTTGSQSVAGSTGANGAVTIEF